MPGPTDVLVGVELVVVNLVDTLVRSGAYSTLTPFPFVVGRDLVGTVAEAGGGVAGFGPGDRVWCNYRDPDLPGWREQAATSRRAGPP